MAVQVGDIVRTTLKWADTHSSQIQNVFHFIAEGADPWTDYQAGTALLSWLGTRFAPLLPDIRIGVHGIEMLVDRIEFVLDAWEIVERVWSTSDLDALTGTLTSEALPPATSLLIRFPTAVPGHEGRKYIGGMGEAESDTDGTPSSDCMTDAITAAALMVLPAIHVEVDGSLTPVIPDADQDIYRFFNQAIVPNEWAYQRRRKVGTGI